MGIGRVKEKIEDKKTKLEILKNNFNLLKNDRQLVDKFYIEKDGFAGEYFYDISQSKYSLALLFSALKYPEARICFFVELFNLYQNLEGNVLYRSCFSQPLTTYVLKQFSKNRLIDFNLQKETYKVDLSEYAHILGNDGLYDETKMYLVKFYKLRNLKENDLPLITSIANMMKINFNDLEIYYKNNNMYLRLKRNIVLKQVLSLEYFKRMFMQREKIVSIIKEYKDYIFEDYNDDYKRNLKY